VVARGLPPPPTTLQHNCHQPVVCCDLCSEEGSPSTHASQLNTHGCPSTALCAGLWHLPTSASVLGEEKGRPRAPAPLPQCEGWTR
jgi:hypothetical protein